MITKKKSNLKLLFCLLQLVVTAFLFFVLIDKQTVLEIQRIVQSLNINGDIQSIMARFYLTFKMTFDAPSCVGLLFVIVQVFCATCIVSTLLYFYPKRNDLLSEKINTPKYRGKTSKVVEKYFHLAKVRLLN